MPRRFATPSDDAPSTPTPMTPTAAPPSSTARLPSAAPAVPPTAPTLSKPPSPTKPAVACSHCGVAAKSLNVRRCGKCRKAFYCSTTCQRSAWTSGHKTECQTPEEAAAAKLAAEKAEKKRLKASKRCAFTDCKKRLKLSDVTCVCEARFCPAHRLPETHSCGYDFSAAGKARLAAANPTIVAAKVDRI